MPIEERDPNGLAPSDPGAKLDDGKVKAGVLGDFGLALWAVAEVGTYGLAKGYHRGGWQKVEDGVTRYNDAMWRHLLKERYDGTDESGLRHLAHRAWNALAELELALREERDKGSSGVPLQQGVTCSRGHHYLPMQLPDYRMECPYCHLLSAR